MKFRRVILSLAVLGALLACTPFSTQAADNTKKSDSGSDSSKSQNPTSAGLQSYTSDSVLQTGTIVQLDGSKQDKVMAASQSKLNQMFGVVIDPQSLPITFSSGGNNEVYVATSGTYDALVSTQGGEISSGDYVTLSSVDGVAMKASEKEKTVFGRAAASFNSKSDGLGQISLKDSNGQSQTATLGRISVVIDIKHNPNDKSTKANVPNFLQRIGQAIAEKPVGPLRIYLSVFIAGVSIVIALMTLYSGVRTSIYSIARNPLSKKTILRGLMTVVLTSIIILIIGLFAVYLLLKL